MTSDAIARRRQKAAEDAAIARADLTVLHAVKALLSNSLSSGNCSLAATRILRICQAEGDKCLERYDAALERLDRLAKQENDHG